jgi:hypothetical protein
MTTGPLILTGSRHLEKRLPTIMDERPFHARRSCTAHESPNESTLRIVIHGRAAITDEFAEQLADVR